MKPVEQVARIAKWKKCKCDGKCECKGHDLRKVKGWILYRLSRLDFMAQWSEKDQEAFIKEWNDGHNDKPIAQKDPFVQFVNILQLGIGSDVESKIRYTEYTKSSKRLDAILAKRIEAKANVMRYLQYIRCVSMIVYADCISKDTRKTLSKSGWIIKSHGKKENRDVVEIKYDLRSRFEWDENEVQDVFNPIREKDEDKKRRGQDQVFTVASNVFEAPTSNFVPKEDDRMSCH